MAEVAGLVVSAVPLVALLQTCLSFYDQIESLRYKNEDLKYVITRAAFERCRYLLLCDRLNSSCTVWSPPFQMMIRHTLEQIEVSLERLYKVLCYHLSRLDNQGHHVPKSGNKVFRTLKWLASDQQTAERMISRLKELNDQLEILLPTGQHGGLHFGLIAHSIISADPTELEDVREAARLDHPAISLAAEARALRIENFRDLRVVRKELPRTQITALNSFDWSAGLLQEMWSNKNGKTATLLHDVMNDERAWAEFTDKDSNKTPVLVEWRRGFRSTSSQEGHKYRLEQLVTALNSMHLSSIATVVSSMTNDNEDLPPSTADKLEIDFGSLPCLGWLTVDSNFSHIGLVFRLPYETSSRPLSLYEKIKQDRKRKIGPPELGVRFAIGNKLAEKVANLIAIGWVHKSVRSNNILLFEPVAEGHPPVATFPASDISTSTSTGARNTTADEESQLHIDGIYLTGFSYARPGDPSSYPDLSTLPAHNPAYVLYLPPRKIASKDMSGPSHGSTPSPTTNTDTALPLRKDASLDVYGLGVILLEIALWKTIDTIYREICAEGQDRNQSKSSSSSTISTMTIQEFQESPQLKRLIQSLDSRVGKIYRSVVQKCLTLEGWHSSSPPSVSPVWSSTIPRHPPPPGYQHQYQTHHDLHESIETQETLPKHQSQDQTETLYETKFLESILTSLGQCRA